MAEITGKATEAALRLAAGPQWASLDDRDRTEVVKFGLFLRCHGSPGKPVEDDQPLLPGQARPCACGQPVAQRSADCECPCHEPDYLGIRPQEQPHA